MSEHTFDPDVLELLGRIATDPESRLVQSPRGPLRRWLRGSEEMLSARQPGLTKLEQHLVSAYREQVAEVLRLMSVDRIAREGTLVFLEKSRRMEPSTLNATAARCAVSNAGASGMEPSIFTMLRFPDGHTSVQLAIAAVRLAPSGMTRMALGLALFSEARHDEALDAFTSAAAQAATAALRSLGLENQGMVLSARQEYLRAFEAYSESCRAAPNRLVPRVSQFAMSLQAADADRARESAVRLQEIDVPPGLFEQAIAVMQEAKERGTWGAISVGTELARSLRESLPPRARRISDVFWRPS